MCQPRAWRDQMLGKKRGERALEMNLVSSNSDFQGGRDFSFVFKVGDFKDRRGAVMVTTRRCLMSGDVLKTPLPCRGLLSHLDRLSEWRAGKPFYSFLLFPPFRTSLHPLSPVLALLHFSPRLILNPSSYPRFWLRCFFLMRHLAILSPRKQGWK